jgi:hypothetical protein
VVTREASLPNRFDEAFIRSMEQARPKIATLNNHFSDLTGSIFGPKRAGKSMKNSWKKE